MENSSPAPKLKCIVPENFHTSPIEGHWKFLRVCVCVCVVEGGGGGGLKSDTFISKVLSYVN